MHPSLALALAILSLLMPFEAIAASGSTLLQTDLQALSGAVLDLRAEDAIQKVEEALESQSDLLPLSASGSAVVREQLTPDTFLTAVIDGQDMAFRDAVRESWYAPFVRAVLESGWMSGYRDEFGAALGLFGPDDSVTVEQLAKVAAEVSGRTAASCAQTGSTLLSRLAQGRWSEPYVRCAETLGWAVYSDGSEDLSRPALRREVVTTILQAFRVAPVPATGTVFADVKKNLAFAAFVERAAADGIVSGYTSTDGQATGNFGPDDAVNRAALAKILFLASQAYAVR